MFSPLQWQDGTPIRWEDNRLALLQDSDSLLFEVPPNFGYIDTDGTNAGVSVEALAECIVGDSTVQAIPVEGDPGHPTFTVTPT